MNTETNGNEGNDEAQEREKNYEKELDNKG